MGYLTLIAQMHALIRAHPRAVGLGNGLPHAREELRHGELLVKGRAAALDTCLAHLHMCTETSGSSEIGALLGNITCQIGRRATLLTHM